MAQPPLKHVVQDRVDGQAGGTLTKVLVTGVLNPDPYTNPTNIKSTNLVRKVSLFIDWTPDVNPIVNGTYTVDMYVGFNINGAQPMPVASSVQTSHIANQIFWQEQFNISEISAGARQPRIIRIDIKIPPSWSKFGDGDNLELRLSASIPAGATYSLKYMAIYKEIYP